jgi:hypothetical protein
MAAKSSTTWWSNRRLPVLILGLQKLGAIHGCFNHQHPWFLNYVNALHIEQLKTGESPSAPGCSGGFILAVLLLWVVKMSLEMRE